MKIVLKKRGKQLSIQWLPPNIEDRYGFEDHVNKLEIDL